MTTKNCSVDNCARLYRAKGYCSFHLYRFNRYGDPEVDAGLTPEGEPLRWIMKLLDKPPTTECIPWPWNTTGQGYGQVSLLGKTRNASAAVMIIRSGLDEHPEGWQVCHMPIICHNRSCVNPLHLKWDTPTGNHADRVSDRTDGFRFSPKSTDATDKPMEDTLLTPEEAPSVWY